MGLDPSYDEYGKSYKHRTGIDINSGVYLGNQSKSISRRTASSRYDKYIRGGGRGNWGDPGSMLTIKMPMSEYNRLRKRESDPLSDVIFDDPKYKKDYKRRGFLGKLKLRSKIGLMKKDLRDNVVLSYDKIDPKYIVNIDPSWS